jgi:hypothetical protein
MNSETLPESASSRQHKPSIWSKILAIREFGSLVALAIVPKGKIAIITDHTLRQQLKVLKDGYLRALIGQRPFKMGAKAFLVLKGRLRERRLKTWRQVLTSSMRAMLTNS